MGVHQFVGLKGVDDICGSPVLETADVVHRVVTHLMASIDNLLEELGVFPHIVAYHEEGGLGTERIERFENERRSLGDGSVIEGQIDCAFVRIHPPSGMWVKPPDISGWSFNNHLLRLLHELSALALIDSGYGLQFLEHAISILRINGICYFHAVLHDVYLHHTVLLVACHDIVVE